MVAARRDIEVPFAGLTLRGWLYEPAAEARRPPQSCVVMAHGFSGVKEMVLPLYAEAISSHGHAVVLFDHAGFGESDGERRQHVDPAEQIAGYRAVLDWACEQPVIDPGRLGVWGTSLSGGHAISLAALDPRVRAAVAQVPYVRPPLDEIPAGLTAALEAPGGSDLEMPVVTAEPTGGGFLSSDPDGYRFFLDTAAAAPSWRNEVSLASVAEMLRYRPADHCRSVQAPVLVIAALDDVLCPIEATRAAFGDLPESCELLEVATGHFGVYGEWLGLTSDAAARWFDRWLAST